MEKEKKDEYKLSDIQKKIIRDGLLPSSPLINFIEYEKIYVDLDSILSIFIRFPIPEDKEERMDLITNIMGVFKEFFTIYGESHMIILKYGFKPEVFKKVYPKWQNVREERLLNEVVLNFITHELLPRFRRIATKLENIFLEEWSEAFLIDIIQSFELNDNAKKSIVISRNPQSICLLAYYDANIYNGSKIITKDNYRSVKNYPDVDRSFIPIWFLIRGDERNEYKGVSKYGIKKTNDFINKNKIECVDLSHDLFKKIKEYKNLYFLKEWI